MAHDTLGELIQRILERPEMYLGELGWSTILVELSGGSDWPEAFAGFERTFSMFQASGRADEG